MNKPKTPIKNFRNRIKHATEYYRGMLIITYHDNILDLYYSACDVAYDVNDFYGFLTPQEATENIKPKIDQFLDKPRKDYNELAYDITRTLIVDSSGEYSVDPIILEGLVESFLRNRKQ